MLTGIQITIYIQRHTRIKPTDTWINRNSHLPKKVSRVTAKYQSKRWRYKVYYREIQGSNPYKGTGVLLLWTYPWKRWKNSLLQETFYNEVNSLELKSIMDKHLLVVLGESNAKTGTGYLRFLNNMEKFGNRIINNNWEHLLEYANLVLIDTLLEHSKTLPTTWTSLQWVQEHLTYRTERWNPYWNQIGYVIYKNIHKVLFRYLRSYSV